VRAIKDQELAAAHTMGNGRAALPDAHPAPSPVLVGV